jgi:glucuronate isomerase
MAALILFGLPRLRASTKPPIPARRNAARHGDCAFLATLVASGRQDAVDATEVTHDLAYSPAKQAHKL